ncbi:MAG TPA: DUF6544 family protein [Longimicrobiales bacterium]|nr:DUF6544 family protein [Longimicrobiales bacterium]
MKWALVALFTVHGLIHLMGPAKAFGWAELPQLAQPISRVGGVLWLGAAIGLLATAAGLGLSHRYWWVVGLAAVICSQVVILSSWSDAKFGTVANLVLLVVVAWGFMSRGPLGLEAEYRADVAARLADVPETPVLRESDLASLPEPVRRYVRTSGAVGRPIAHHVRAVWRGRIRSGPDDPWMTFSAEQWNFVSEPARFFLMRARRGGLPVDVYHAFEDGEASMRVRLLSTFPLVDASGPEFTRAETVTILNELALLSPSALASSPDIRWEPVDDHAARAHYRVGGVEVGAVLRFEDGELVDFVSDDRLAASADGTDFVPRRWSTPVGDYREVDGLRLMSRGEGRWHTSSGSYAYIELELLDLEVNGGV